MIASTNHFLFMAILAHGSPTGSAIYICGPRLNEARSRALQSQLFSFHHAGVAVCHRESHSAMNCGLSNRRYIQRSRACGTGS